jgi:hypothetical protein
MHATFAAALNVARTALDELSEMLAGLPDEALDWSPAEGSNSIAVLTRHGLTATVFLASTAAGLNPDRKAYLEGDRVEAFKARNTSPALLREEIARTLAAIEGIMAHGSDASLAAAASWNWPNGRTPPGAELLIHSVGHLKEHAGQASLIRDLWVARGRGGQ